MILDNSAQSSDAAADGAEGCDTAFTSEVPTWQELNRRLHNANELLAKLLEQVRQRRSAYEKSYAHKNRVDPKEDPYKDIDPDADAYESMDPEAAEALRAEDSLAIRHGMIRACNKFLGKADLDAALSTKDTEALFAITEPEIAAATGLTLGGAGAIPWWLSMTTTDSADRPFSYAEIEAALRRVKLKRADRGALAEAVEYSKENSPYSFSPKKPLLF